MTFTTLLSVTSASYSAAFTFTNMSDPASSAPAQAQVGCYQTLMQSLDIPLEHACLLIPRWLWRTLPPTVTWANLCGFSSVCVLVIFFFPIFSLFLCRFCPLRSHHLSFWQALVDWEDYPSFLSICTGLKILRPSPSYNASGSRAREVSSRNGLAEGCYCNV